MKGPVGTIHSSWDGSKIEAWWAEEGLKGIPELAAAGETRLAKCPDVPEYDARFRTHLTAGCEWTDAAAKA